jgi:Mg2+/Co2+ transporter CorB
MLIISKIIDFILKKLNINGSIVAGGDHLDLLRGVIEQYRGKDIDRDAPEINQQRAMLKSILDLTDVSVAEIMTHRKKMMSVNSDQSNELILEEILKSPYTRVPLWKDTPDNIIGVIHAKALLREFVDKKGKMDQIQIPSFASNPWFIPDTTTLFDQLQAFRKRKEHFALVVDEYGSLMGTVTLEDILEEIVGDIDDEYDVTVMGVRKKSHNSWMIDGTVTIRDLNREFEWNLPDDHYATLAGLILYESHSIPDVDQVFTFYNLTFKIIRRHRNQITLLQVTLAD